MEGEKMQDSRVDPISRREGEEPPLPVAFTN